jgi:hypothetical protein
VQTYAQLRAMLATKGTAIGVNDLVDRCHWAHAPVDGSDAQYPSILLPFVAQVAVGRREFLNVWGDDYQEGMQLAKWAT